MNDLGYYNGLILALLECLKSDASDTAYVLKNNLDQLNETSKSTGGRALIDIRPLAVDELPRKQVKRVKPDIVEQRNFERVMADREQTTYAFLTSKYPSKTSFTYTLQRLVTSYLMSNPTETFEEAIARMAPAYLESQSPDPAGDGVKLEQLNRRWSHIYRSFEPTDYEFVDSVEPIEIPTGAALIALFDEVKIRLALLFTQLDNGELVYEKGESENTVRLIVLQAMTDVIQSLPEPELTPDQPDPLPADTAGQIQFAERMLKDMQAAWTQWQTIDDLYTDLLNRDRTGTVHDAELRTIRWFKLQAQRQIETKRLAFEAVALALSPRASAANIPMWLSIERIAIGHPETDDWSKAKTVLFKLKQSQQNQTSASMVPSTANIDEPTDEGISGADLAKLADVDESTVSREKRVLVKKNGRYTHASAMQWLKCRRGMLDWPEVKWKCRIHSRFEPSPSGNPPKCPDCGNSFAISDPQRQ